MWPDRVSNPGLLTYESGALPTALYNYFKLRTEKSTNYNKIATQLSLLMNI